MIEEKFYISLGSVPYREKLISEIYYDGNQFAEFSHETGDVIVQFYSHPDKQYWEFFYLEIIQVIKKAKNRLVTGKKEESESREKFRITVATLPDREYAVSEIFYDHVQFCEISRKVEGQFVIQFYPHPRQEYWEFSYDEIMEVLEKAKKSLEVIFNGPHESEKI